MKRGDKGVFKWRIVIWSVNFKINKWKSKQSRSLLGYLLAHLIFFSDSLAGLFVCQFDPMFISSLPCFEFKHAHFPRFRKQAFFQKRLAVSGGSSAHTWHHWKRDCVETLHGVSAFTLPMSNVGESEKMKTQFDWELWLETDTIDGNWVIRTVFLGFIFGHEGLITWRNGKTEWVNQLCFPTLLCFLICWPIMLSVRNAHHSASYSASYHAFYPNVHLLCFLPDFRLCLQLAFFFAYNLLLTMLSTMLNVISNRPFKAREHHSPQVGIGCTCWGMIALPTGNALYLILELTRLDCLASLIGTRLFCVYVTRKDESCTQHTIIFCLWLRCPICKF